MNRSLPFIDYGIGFAPTTPYLKLPPATNAVSVELTYHDGSVSGIKSFQR